MYTKLIAKNGKEMFYKDGKLVKRSEYESNTQTVDEIVDERPQLTQTKPCLFCNQPMEYNRFVNGTVVDLCQQHYELSTTGEIAERLNKLKG